MAAWPPLPSLFFLLVHIKKAPKETQSEVVKSFIVFLRSSVPSFFASLSSWCSSDFLPLVSGCWITVLSLYSKIQKPSMLYILVSCKWNHENKKMWSRFLSNYEKKESVWNNEIILLILLFFQILSFKKTALGYNMCREKFRCMLLWACLTVPQFLSFFKQWLCKIV